jgi:hypothetical protein
VTDPSTNCIEASFPEIGLVLDRLTMFTSLRRPG